MKKQTQLLHCCLILLAPGQPCNNAWERQQGNKGIKSSSTLQLPQLRSTFPNKSSLKQVGQEAGKMRSSQNKTSPEKLYHTLFILLQITKKLSVSDKMLVD